MKESNNIKKVVLFSLASACIGLISCDDYLKEKDLPRLTPTIMEPLPVWSPPQQQHIASCVGELVMKDITYSRNTAQISSRKEKIRENKLTLLTNMEAS